MSNSALAVRDNVSEVDANVLAVVLLKLAKNKIVSPTPDAELVAMKNPFAADALVNPVNVFAADQVIDRPEPTVEAAPQSPVAIAIRAYEPVPALISVQPEGVEPPVAVRAGTVLAVAEVKRPTKKVVSTVPPLKMTPSM